MRAPSRVWLVILFLASPCVTSSLTRAWDGNDAAGPQAGNPAANPPATAGTAVAPRAARQKMSSAEVKALRARRARARRDGETQNNAPTSSTNSGFPMVNWGAGFNAAAGSASGTSSGSSGGLGGSATGTGLATGTVGGAATGAGSGTGQVGSGDASIPLLNQKVLEFATANLGKQVDNGICYELGVEALNYAGARPPSGVVFGNAVALTSALPGDILEFNTARFVGANYWMVLGSPYHTAILSQVDGTQLTMLNQNVNNVRVVTITRIDMNDLKSGTLTVYRPAPRN